MIYLVLKLICGLIGVENIHEKILTVSVVIASIEHYGIGNSAYMDECWQIKEKIEKEQNLLKQAKTFYTNTYMTSDVYIARSDEEEIVGFAIMTGQDYLALLGVKPRYQDDGIGTEIIDYLKSEYDTIHCHTRESNEGAVRFYESNGFFIEDLEPNYYANNEDAFILQYETDSYSS